MRGWAGGGGDTFVPHIVTVEVDVRETKTAAEASGEGLRPGDRLLFKPWGAGSGGYPVGSRRDQIFPLFRSTERPENPLGTGLWGRPDQPSCHPSGGGGRGEGGRSTLNEACSVSPIRDFRMSATPPDGRWKPMINSVPTLKI